jgi:repressor LexA
MQDLSPRQRAMLDFIAAHVDQHGVSPTYRDIGAALGIKSTNGVSDHLKALERKGYIERIGGPGSPRAIKLTSQVGPTLDEGVAHIPLLGRIAAGVPLLASENYEGSLRVDRDLLPTSGTVFALHIAGDSMIDDGILDGDTVFVRQQETCRDGEIAAVLVEDEATVKRVYREGRRLRLQPANPDMEAFYVDARSGDVSILGVVVGVFRRVH